MNLLTDFRLSGDVLALEFREPIEAVSRFLSDFNLVATSFAASVETSTFVAPRVFRGRVSLESYFPVYSGGCFALASGLDEILRPFAGCCESVEDRASGSRMHPDGPNSGTIHVRVEIVFSVWRAAS